VIRTNSRLFNEEDENDVIFAKSSSQTQYQEGSESGAEKTDDRSFAKIDSHCFGEARRDGCGAKEESSLVTISHLPPLTSQGTFA
jgi:hypothetical protein